MSNVKKTELKKGQTLKSGFTVLDVVDLEEIKAAGIWAKHDKSGAEVFHVLNDDNENLFTFAFTTFPQDNTGVPHILEHAVLCGSERYPLKDAFIILAQGSLQTFLNALTFPDKTIYPASSVNEHDYFNLMSVYGDAVFRPLLPEWVFLQEGFRYEYQDGKLNITGVVYNEMKGAYSSLDTYASHWSVRAVMPETPYAFESGGDPQDIPSLTYEGLKEFHRSRYSPANCRIFLTGNIPTEKQLDFLDREFFSSLPPLPGTGASGTGEKTGNPCVKTPVKAQRWNEPKNYHIFCPAGNNYKSTVYLSWLCSDITDINEIIALSALTEILLGHDGSPLTRTLIESGLGEDITPVSGLEGEIRETIFVAGLKGVEGDPGNASHILEISKSIQDLIITTLQNLVTNGIPAEETEAALLAMEFSQREIRRSGGPFSLVWMRRSLRSWLHGSKPWEGLLLQPALDRVKQNLAENSRYFETLIQKYFLDNPHRALVIIEPKEDFLPKQEEKLLQSLAEMDKNMNDNERRQIMEKSEALEKIQSQVDSPQSLAAIPHLSRKDLSAEHDIIHRRHEDLNGVPAICHDLFTNGITYIDITFPIDIFPAEDILWLPFFSRAVISVGLPGMDYGEVSSLLARTVGGFNTLLHTGSSIKGSQYLQTASGLFDLSGRNWIIFRLKCLDEKIVPSLDIAQRLISEADFTDHRRLKDLVMEMKTQIDSSLAPMGHIYASGRANRSNSGAKKTEELWGGLSQINFVHHLTRLDIETIEKKLAYLREKITGAGLIVNITGNSSETACKEITKRFSRFGSPAPRQAADSENIITLPKPFTEVYASKSLQIGFAARSCYAAIFDTIEQVAEGVLTHQLSTGALWEDIRMKGGAYGASVSSDSIESCVCFATYRDPNPLQSLDVISAILKNGPPKNYTEDYLVKSIIGCYGKETKPRTSAENGMIDFFRFLYNVDDGYRKRKLERLINISNADITAAFAALGSRSTTGTVIITGEKKAEQAAKMLNTDVQMLPI